MSGVYQAVTILICSVFVAALIKIISPAGNTEKVLRLVISMFVLLCMAISFRSIFVSIKESAENAGFAMENNVSIEKSVDEDVLKITGDYVVEHLQKLIAAEGVEAKLIEVSLNTDENSVININSINIYIEHTDSQYRNKISDVVEEYINITPSVIVGE